jgi:hypothetical protein
MGTYRRPLGNRAASFARTRCRVWSAGEFHPPIRTGNALDQAMGLQSVGKTCHVGGIAGQVLGQTAHRGRLFKPQHGAGLQRSQAELAGNLSEVSLGTLGHRKSAWTAGIAIGIKLIVLGVGRVAGADMSVQPPGSAAPMIIGGPAGRGHV